MAFGGGGPVMRVLGVGQRLSLGENESGKFSCHLIGP